MEESDQSNSSRTSASTERHEPPDQRATRCPEQQTDSLPRYIIVKCPNTQKDNPKSLKQEKNWFPTKEQESGWLSDFLRAMLDIR